ncbi:MAG: hypothetical protein U9N61_01710 [Euryarchaeota archaeon]|nr:hypothetical protein [Euryarchaeota archaeon]
MKNVIYATIAVLMLIVMLGCESPTETSESRVYVADTIYEDSVVMTTGDTLWIFTKDRLYLRAKEVGDNVYYHSEKYSDSLITAHDSVYLIGIPYNYPIIEVRWWYQNQSEGGQAVISNIGSEKALWWDPNVDGFYDELHLLDKDSIEVLINN